MTNLFTGITIVQLRRALAIREKIEGLERELGRILDKNSNGGAEPNTSNRRVVKSKRGRRKMSAAARGKIAAAQRKRWAALKSKKGT
jgi:hypothetical protein